MDDNTVDGEGVSSESVEEWLAEMAETEGRSQEEVLEELLSSYWRLEEIFHILQDSGIDLDNSPDLDEEPEWASKTSLDELHDRVDRLATDLEKSQAETVSQRELKDAVSELETRLDAFETQFDDLGRELSAILDSPVGDPDRLADWLRSQDSRLERLEANVSDVDERVKGLSETTVSKEQFEAYTIQEKSFRESMWDEHRTLRDRVRTEFEHIRTIFDHVLELPGTDEDRLRNVVSPIEDSLEDHLEERETLRSLAQTANREGIREAACARCDQAVDLALLETPECPNCEGRFDRLETRPRYWGLSQRYVLSLVDEPGGD